MRQIGRASDVVLWLRFRRSRVPLIVHTTTSGWCMTSASQQLCATPTSAPSEAACLRPVHVAGCTLKLAPLCARLLQGSTEGYGWNDLVASGFIEYVDTEEEETTMIAMTIKDLQAARSNPQARPGPDAFSLARALHCAVSSFALIAQKALFSPPLQLSSCLM